MKKIFIFSVLIVVLVTQNACNEEYLNPSTATREQAVGSADGLIALCNGLQHRYSTGGALSVLYSRAAAGGLTTGELTVLNVGNIEEFNLSQGAGNVTNTNSVVRNLWTNNHLIKSNADLILANTGVVAVPGTKSGIIAYASIFRALALGNLGEFFEQAPIETKANAVFVPRQQLFQAAVAQLEAAAAQIASVPVSAVFTEKIVLGPPLVPSLPASRPGIDIPNTIQALIARYSLYLGDYDKAIAAAGAVDLSKRSVFIFDDNTRNPLFETAFSNANVFAPFNAQLGLSGDLAPATDDKRLAFFIRSNPLPTQNLGTGFYTAANATIPVYVPGEMLLIRAEAYARKGELPNAITELNKVLTKKPVDDPFGLGADLPAYSGPETAEAVLLEILRNRNIELALQGFRLEDSRRFSRPGPGATGAERNRNFLPYPRTERDNNTSTPADPAI
jgi:tetratricopeptide (TPR) repeat protein